MDTSDGNLSAALTSDPTGGSSAAAPVPAPDLGSGPPSGTGTSSNLGGAIQPSNPAPPAVDLPRFQRTFGNTLKAMLIGFGQGNVLGAAQGAIEPGKVLAIQQRKTDVAEADKTFASARAAHEVAMAHQADVEYQALPEKLQQDAEKRGLENMTAARQAGYLPIATVPLDQGQDQNSQGAMTALNSVKQQFGAVPSGLLYVHTGSGMTVMKLQDPNAALTTINQARRAQGMPEIQQAAFMQLAPADRDSMARDAINFADPRDTNGMVTQNSINIATMRLATVKAQPEFNGKDALVKSLQQTVDHQKAVLDSGAQAEAQRKGLSVGTEAQAAQPGQTAAKVAEIKATAGPEANAAGQKAGAEAAAKFPWEARLEQMKQQGDPVFAFDPKNKQTVQVSRSEAMAGGFTNIVKVTQPEIDKAKTSAMQLGDATMNIQAYKMASQKMDNLSGGDVATVSRVIGSDQFKAHFLGMELPVDWANQLYQQKGWQDMPESAKDAVVNYIAARPAAISLLRAINPGVRLTESQIETELKNIPSPATPSDIREKQFARLDRNIDQASKTLVKVPGVELPSEIRERLQGQEDKSQSALATNDARNAAQSGQYRNAGGHTMQVGQEAFDNSTKQFIGKVSRVYANGTYDVQPDKE